MKKIMITAEAHPVLAASFEAAGFEVLFQPKIDYTALLAVVAGLHGLVVTTRLKIDAAMLAPAKNLKFIGRLGSGLELIDLVAAAANGTQCISTPDGNCTAVGEHALGLLLSSFNHLHRAVHEVKQHVWLRNENRGTELTGKTVGIIGYGYTGSAFAKVLQGFDVQILAHDKYKKGFANGSVKEAGLKEIQTHADVISFHLPLTEETLHYASDPFFNALKKAPLMLNCSRGKIVNTAALIAALKQGIVSAAALDVLENENLSELNATESEQLNELLKMQNVLITPHIAGYTHEAFYKMSAYLLQKLGIAVVNTA